MTVLKSPPKLCIYSDADRPATLNFLNMIETLVLKHQSEVLIDLSDVKYASAAASVLLFAIVNRSLFITSKSNLIRFKWPKKEKNPDGHRWVVSTGLSIALSANTTGKLANLTKDKRYFQSAVEPFEHWKETIDMIDETALLTFEQFLLVSSAISEAMLNVSYHAYQDESFNSHIELMNGKRWWQCSWYNKETNKVVFIICDLGLGIHRSFTSASTMFTGFSEVTSVQTALSAGQSRYVNAGRGNGSEDIKRPIGSGCADSETLLVFTGHARYSYNSNNPMPQCERLPEFIPGTLIEWSLVPRRGEDG